MLANTSTKPNLAIHIWPVELNALAHGSIQTLTAGLILLELLRLGVEDFILSPGARTIPFVLALNLLSESNTLSQTKPNIILVNDERSACFMAQGMSKTGKLACLICTSGTAVANYLPGVIEAFYSKAPLLIVTTDRPWELQNAGANQTIRQGDIFSDFISKKVDISAPEKEIHFHSLLSNINILVHSSRASRIPAHLNIAFRKPFYDAGFSLEKDLSEDEVGSVNEWFSSSKQYIEFVGKNLEYKINLENSTNIPEKKTLFILGPTRDENLISAVVYLAKELHIPIVADIHSNARCKHYPNIFSGYNFFLDQIEVHPEQIVVFGDRFISDALVRYIQKQQCTVVQVSSHEERQDAIENEFVVVNKRIETSIFFNEYVRDFPRSPNEYFEEVLKCEKGVQSRIESIVETEDSTERALLASLPLFLPEDVDVFLSSSLIFREADCYSSSFPKGVRLFSNRGAVGIDGVISSSIGVALGGGRPMVCVVGDQAALHDLTALSLLHLVHRPIVILIINNDGGAIFNLLKKAELKQTLVNPHKRDFCKFAEGFGLDYLCTNSVKNASKLIRSTLFGNDNSKLILEVKVDGVESAKNLYNI